MENSLHYKISVISNKLKTCMGDASTYSGILPGQLKIMEYLYNHPGSLRKDIALVWNVDKSTMSGLINRMERDGLIICTEIVTDKRRKMLNITDKGKSAFEKVYPLLKEIDLYAMKDISEQEKDIFINVLNRISNNLSDYKRLKSKNERDDT